MEIKFLDNKEQESVEEFILEAKICPANPSNKNVNARDLHEIYAYWCLRYATYTPISIYRFIAFLRIKGFIYGQVVFVNMNHELCNVGSNAILKEKYLEHSTNIIRGMYKDVESNGSVEFYDKTKTKTKPRIRSKKY